MPEAVTSDPSLPGAPEPGAPEPGAPEPEAPATRAELRSAYLDQAAMAYLLYGVGAVTAFLAVALSLTDASAALHSSLLAAGFLAAGISGDRLDARVGFRGTQLLSYALLAAASLCLATAAAFPLTLAGAGMAGLGAGLLLAHINRTFTRGGGPRARVQMGRAGLVAMVASLSVPVAIWLGEETGVGWQLAFAGAGVLIAAGVWSSRRREATVRQVPASSGRLRAGYWLAWALLVLAVSVEFSFVFWASTLVERQVGISLADATLVATGFYAGMTTTRIGLSFHLVGGRDPIALIVGSLLVVLAGSSLAWISTAVEPAALGVYLGGLGVGALYPMTVSVALSLVPGHEDRASMRLLLASGTAILLAPFVLGLAADLSDVSVAWLLIPGLCLAALALCLPLHRARLQPPPS